MMLVFLLILHAKRKVRLENFKQPTWTLVHQYVQNKQSSQPLCFFLFSFI